MLSSPGPVRKSLKYGDPLDGFNYLFKLLKGLYKAEDVIVSKSISVDKLLEVLAEASGFPTTKPQVTALDDASLATIDQFIDITYARLSNATEVSSQLKTMQATSETVLKNHSLLTSQSELITSLGQHMDSLHSDSSARVMALQAKVADLETSLKALQDTQGTLSRSYKEATIGKPTDEVQTRFVQSQIEAEVLQRVYDQDKYTHTSLLVNLPGSAYTSAFDAPHARKVLEKYVPEASKGAVADIVSARPLIRRNDGNSMNDDVDVTLWPSFPVLIKFKSPAARSALLRVAKLISTNSNKKVSIRSYLTRDQMDFRALQFEALNNIKDGRPDIPQRLRFRGHAIEYAWMEGESESPIFNTIRIPPNKLMELLDRMRARSPASRPTTSGWQTVSRKKTATPAASASVSPTQ